MTRTFIQFGTCLVHRLARWLQAHCEHKLEKYAAVHHLADS